MPTFFAPKGKFLKIGKIKFHNHLFTTNREDEAEKVRKSQGFGISIFELGEGVNAADLVKAGHQAVLGPVTTTNQKPHKSVEHFFQSKNLEILDTEARMQANRNSPLLKPTSLANYSKETLVKLCEDFFVEHSAEDTRKVLIQKLKDFSGQQPEE